MVKNEYIIGLISDTHANQTNGKLVMSDSLRNELKNCDLIIHLGDIGHRDVLTELAMIAPVIAIAGNCECDNCVLSSLPKEIYLYIFQWRIVAMHIILSGPIKSYTQELSNDLLDRYVDIFFPYSDIVLFAHTHEPMIKQTNRRLYINSGAINRPREKPSIVKLFITSKDISAKIYWDENYVGETLKE